MCRNCNNKNDNPTVVTTGSATNTGDKNNNTGGFVPERRVDGGGTGDGDSEPYSTSSSISSSSSSPYYG